MSEDNQNVVPENEEPANIEDVQPEQENEEVTNTEGEESEAEEPSNNRYKKRINKLTAQKYEAQQAAKRLEEENQRYKDKLTQIEERLENIAPANPRPDRYDFDDEDDYLDALLEWKISSRKEPAKTEPTNDAPKDTQSDIDVDIKEVMDQGLDKYDDFGIVVGNPNLNQYFTQEVSDAILNSENPADVTYQLAKNPGQLVNLVNQTPDQISATVSKIDAGFSPAKTKQRSDAPEPIQPVGGGGDSGITEEPKDIDAWIAWRNRTAKM